MHREKQHVQTSQTWFNLRKTYRNCTYVMVKTQFSCIFSLDQAEELWWFRFMDWPKVNFWLLFHGFSHPQRWFFPTDKNPADLWSLSPAGMTPWKMMEFVNGKDDNGWHPIYETENNTCLKPPTRFALAISGADWLEVPTIDKAYVRAM